MLKSNTHKTSLTVRSHINDENNSDFQPLAPSWRDKRKLFLEQARLAKLAAKTKPTDNMSFEILASSVVESTVPRQKLCVSQTDCVVVEASIDLAAYHAMSSSTDN